MRLRISHRTHYRYDAPVPYALQQLRKTPKERAGQKVLNWVIEIEGGRKEVEFDDQNNNRVTLVSLEPNLHEITLLCEGEVETIDKSGVVGVHGGCAPLWYFQRVTELTKPGPRMRALVRELGSDFDSDLDKVHALSRMLAEKIKYETGTTEVQTGAEEAIVAGKGVCQDHAHALICAARLMGMPARYVSGYLMMNDRVDQDAGHAWAEVFIEGIGWIGFDVSNGICPDERYVAVATGLDYQEAAPVSGVRFGDMAETMTVSLQVQQ